MVSSYCQLLLLLTMLQMLVQNLQLLYHNHQQQVDMENYMNYMLLNPPRGINRRATMATMLGGLLLCFWCILWRRYSATYRPGICTTASPALPSGLVWTEDFFYIVFGSFAFRLRLRVNGVLETQGSGGHRFKPHCSQHVVVSLGKTLHPKLLLWGFPTVLSM